MNITYFNQDHAKVSIAVRDGTTVTNFGFEQGEKHSADYMDAIRLAWWPKDDLINAEQLDKYGILQSKDHAFVFGNPLGKAE